MKQPSGMAELYCLSGTTASADRFIILDFFAGQALLFFLHQGKNERKSF